MDDVPSHPALREAESGDLRFQHNPEAVRLWQLASGHVAEKAAARQLLLRRFFELSRPIGDASKGRDESLRLSDAGRFFNLVDTLKHLGCEQIDETLLVLLDDFAQLDERSYDEVYLWSIVHLSRKDVQHVETFWPMVVALDLRYRGAAWNRPKGVGCPEQPYRLAELLFYYFHLYTLNRTPTHAVYDARRGWLYPEPLPQREIERPSLDKALLRIASTLVGEGRVLLLDTLEALAKAERRPGFGDARGMLVREFARE